MLLIPLLIACKDKDHTLEFPEGLEPLEDSSADWPADDAEELNTAAGEEDEYFWAHGSGYVHASIDDVYPCLREDEVNVDRREVADWDVVMDVEEGYEHSYRIDNYVENIVDLEFSDTWRHGSTADEGGAVGLVVTAWQMTTGNDYMYLKRGSIVSEAVADDVTSVEMVGHLDAALRDEETVRTYLEDFYASLVACVHGEPYPTYD